MSAEPAHIDPRALIERQIAMLSELAELGMDLARGAKTCGPEREPAMVFARAARAVRQTIALQSRLLKDLADLDKLEASARASRASTRRHRAREIIERAIEDGSEDEDEAERLCELAWERLRDADDADLAGLTTAEVVARICRDLGIEAPEWFPSPLGEKVSPTATDEGTAQQAVGLRPRAGPVRRNDGGPAPSSDRVSRPPAPRGEKGSLRTPHGPP